MASNRVLGWVGAACLASVCGAGCGSDGWADDVVGAVEDMLASLDESRFLGPAVTVENLTVWPVYTDEPLEDVGEYLTLREAQDRGVAIIREVQERRGLLLDAPDHWNRSILLEGSERGARVGQLVVENRGDDPIFIPGGTVVKGGKQDRQIAQDIIVAAHTNVPVEAFCIEKNRWTESRDGESTGGKFDCMDMVAAKRVRASAQYDADQTGVWSQVSLLNARVGKSPATSTFMATVEGTDHEAREHRERLERVVSRHFDDLLSRSHDDGVLVGFAYAINGEPLTVRSFADTRLFTSQFDAFRKTMCMEAEVVQRRDRSQGRELYAQPAPVEPLLEMVASLRSADVDEQRHFAHNRNALRRTARGGNAVCLVRAGNEWVPLTEDWTAAVEVAVDVDAAADSSTNWHVMSNGLDGSLQAVGYTR